MVAQCFALLPRSKEVGASGVCLFSPCLCKPPAGAPVSHASKNMYNRSLLGPGLTWKRTWISVGRKYNRNKTSLTCLRSQYCFVCSYFTFSFLNVCIRIISSHSLDRDNYSNFPLFKSWQTVSFTWYFCGSFSSHLLHSSHFSSAEHIMSCVFWLGPNLPTGHVNTLCIGPV